MQLWDAKQFSVLLDKELFAQPFLSQPKCLTAAVILSLKIYPWLYKADAIRNGKEDDMMKYRPQYCVQKNGNFRQHWQLHLAAS